MYQDIEYAETRGSSIKIYARERPAIPAAKKRREEITIPGRDGVLYKSDGSYEPTEIEIPFNYIGREEGWSKRWREAQRWLGKENARLRLSDDDGYFFWISYVDLSENERTSGRIGNFTATFVTRDGLHYLDSGLREYVEKEIRWNPYEISHPVYKIYGEGMCTIEVNGKQMKANVGQNLTIDTERMLAYREGGVIRNTDVTGEYENLYLPEGEVEINVSYGFDIRITPNWRCR